MKPGNKMVYGGAFHDPSLQALDFCIVSTDMECTTAIPSNCIYQNVEYRFRVFGPTKGYLRVIDEELIEIVPEFNQASGLNLYKEKGWGLRVAHRKSNGDLLVITTSAPGHLVFLEEPQKNNGRQWFDLVQPQGMNMDIECKSVTLFFLFAIHTLIPYTLLPLFTNSQNTEIDLVLSAILSNRSRTQPVRPPCRHQGVRGIRALQLRSR